MSVIRFPGRRDVGDPKSVSTPVPATRWLAELTYKLPSGAGEFRTEYFEEIADLDEIIEQGPDWNTLVACVVRLNKAADPNAA